MRAIEIREQEEESAVAGMQKTEEREGGRIRGRASLSPRGETESVPMIGCIPRERGLEERVDRGGEAFNTCGTILPLSIKRIGWITISTPREREKGRKKQEIVFTLTEEISTSRSCDREISDTIYLPHQHFQNKII